MICSACSLLFVVGLGSAMAILWPKSPEWHLRKLTVNDETVLVEYGHALFETVHDNYSLPTFDLLAEIEVYNPNHLGGETLIPGLLDISFREQRLGTVTVHPVIFQPHSHAAMMANVSVRFTSALFRMIRNDVKSNDFKLSVQVQGGIRVQGPLGFEFEVTASCDVHTDVVQVMDQAHRNSVVEAKECRYSYF